MGGTFKECLFMREKKSDIEKVRKSGGIERGR